MKTYTIQWTRYRTNDTTTRYIQGTTDRLAQYCGVKAKNIRSVISKWQKELDDRYGCTYTRVSVEVVDSIPEGANVSVLTD